MQVGTNQDVLEANTFYEDCDNWLGIWINMCLYAERKHDITILKRMIISVDIPTTEIEHNGIKWNVDSAL